MNWNTYIWATNNNHVVEASLGYYMNPLMMIAFGVIFLKEKMRNLQWVSVLIAICGVLILSFDYGHLPWIAFALALSWGSYSLIKKQLGLGALEGLAIETLMSFFPYIIFLVILGSRGENHFGNNTKVTLLLILAGVLTAVPLLFFNGAARRLPLSIVGLLQFITPTLTFSIGIWVRHEQMSVGRWIGFLVIWVALGFLGVDIVRSGSSRDNSLTK